MFRVVLSTLAQVGTVRGLELQTLTTEKVYYGRLVQVRTPVEGFPRPAVKNLERVYRGTNF